MDISFEEFLKRSERMDAVYQLCSETYYSFQRASNDYNPLHTDRDFAKGKGFPACVMYGNILNCFISHFVGMLLPSRDVMIVSQDIQYRNPVFLGDELILKTELDSSSEAVRMVSYKLKFYRTKEREAKMIASGHVQVKLM